MEETLLLRNYFLIGNHQAVLKEANNLLASPSAQIVTFAKTVLLRSFIELGNLDAVFKAVDKNANIALQAVKLYATFKTATEDNKELVFETLKGWSAYASDDATLALISAQIYFEAGDLKEALRLVLNAPDLDRRALCAQIYIRMDRLDLAEKVVKSMQELDDDDVLTSLASTWVSLAQGGDAVNSAYEVLNELIEKFGPTVNLLNTLASCQIHMHNYVDAFGSLKQARELALSNNEKVNPITLINTIVCLTHLNKPSAIIQRIIGELKQSHPDHSWLKRQEEMTSVFDKCAANYA